jgi:acyl carrier protein
MNVKEFIRDYVVSELMATSDGNGLSDSDALIETGVIDSLGIMKLIGFLEEKLSIQIDDMELTPENFASIEAITNLVQSKQAS